MWRRRCRSSLSTRSSFSRFIVSATAERDRVHGLAKTDPKEALTSARNIGEPWFRAQALAWVARFTTNDPVPIATEAARAASKCDDYYKRSAVRAWEIAALAERGYKKEARKSLVEASTLAREVLPISSRGEALMLLLQAAFRIDKVEADKVYRMLEAGCPADEHWRCKRALRDAELMISSEMPPRPFFW